MPRRSCSTRNRASLATFAANSSVASSAPPPEQDLPEKWTVGKPYSALYYCDEPLSNTLPPEMMNLSDAWVGQVVKLNTSLGCILLQLHTGQTPFQADNALEHLIIIERVSRGHI